MQPFLNHKAFIWVGVTVLAGLFCSAYRAGTPTAPARPNILVILTDDQGYHDVSYYGTGDLRTPAIDELARSGMRFDHFYANCTVCSPTRAALLSGRYQDRVGVPGVIRTHPNDSWGYLDPQAVLLPALLKKAGYHTALVGKWHLGLESPNLPTQKGFDYFHGWLGDMMDDYINKRRHGINYMRLNEQPIDPAGHATDLFTNWATAFIRKEATDKAPFFLYLAYNAPHAPVQPPMAWVDKVKKRQPELGAKRAELVAFIEHMDDGIRQVIDALKESGQYENTLIVFSSDNGGHLPSMANNGPVRDGKGSMYEGGLRVPTCVAWPGRVTAGQVSGQINLTMDLFPTLLAAAGVAPPVSIEGRSFLPTLLGQPARDEERPLYFTRREGEASFAGQCSYALRLGKWKLVQNRPLSPLELYDLQTDSLETQNVIKAHPEVQKKMVTLLMAHIQASGSVPWQGPAKR